MLFDTILTIKLCMFMQPPFYFFLMSLFYYKKFQSKKENLIYKYVDDINMKITESMFYKENIIPYAYNQIAFLDKILKNCKENAYKIMMIELLKKRIFNLFTKPATYALDSLSILFLYSCYYSTRYSIIAPNLAIIKSQKFLFKSTYTSFHFIMKKSIYFIRFFKGF